jgi:hypothetical protein
MRTSADISERTIRENCLIKGISERPRTSANLRVRIVAIEKVAVRSPSVTVSVAGKTLPPIVPAGDYGNSSTTQQSGRVGLKDV